MLSAIVAVTLLVPDVDAAAEAYQTALSYEAVERRRVPPEQAALCGAQRLEGREFDVLRPQSGEPMYLRFVETDAGAAPAMCALGWNATEILVEDPVALGGYARRLGLDAEGMPYGKVLAEVFEAVAGPNLIQPTFVTHYPIIEKFREKFRKYAQDHKALPFFSIAGLLVLVVAGTSWFTMQPQETGVVQRFGQVVRTTTPGLHFKWPFAIESVRWVPTARVLKEEFGFRTVSSVRGERTR